MHYLSNSYLREILLFEYLSIKQFSIHFIKDQNSVSYFVGGSDSKASVYNTGDPGSIPGLGRSLEEGNGNPLQDYCLENPMDRGAWQATVHGVAESDTTERLHFTSLQSLLNEKKKKKENE